MLLKGLPWTPAIDMWSVGCILYKLDTGKLLLSPTEDMRERLAAIENIIRYFPISVCQNATNKHTNLFDKGPQPRTIFPNPDCNLVEPNIVAAVNRVASCHPLTVSASQYHHSIQSANCIVWRPALVTCNSPVYWVRCSISIRPPAYAPRQSMTHSCVKRPTVKLLYLGFKRIEQTMYK